MYAPLPPDFHSLEKAELKPRMLFTCLSKGAEEWEHFKTLMAVTDKLIQLWPGTARRGTQHCPGGGICKCIHLHLHRAVQQMSSINAAFSSFKKCFDFH